MVGEQPGHAKWISSQDIDTIHAYPTRTRRQESRRPMVRSQAVGAARKTLKRLFGYQGQLPDLSGHKAVK